MELGPDPVVVSAFLACADAFFQCRQEIEERRRIENAEDETLRHWYETLLAHKSMMASG